MTNLELDTSFRYCIQLAQQSGSNFYYAFLTLPRPMFRDMCALYAFMRVTDDLGDDERHTIEQRRINISEWRDDLQTALMGCFHHSNVVSSTPNLIFPAITDVVQRHGIASDALFEVIAGVESDLSPRIFSSFDELNHYCYQVAGVVGLCCLHIWGFDGSTASIERGIQCGTAFQLINILRDLKEDTLRDRVYLPREDLTAYGYSQEDLMHQRLTPEFKNMMAFQVHRAWTFFEQATPLLQSLPKPGQRILSAMFEIYGRLLVKIEQQQFDVFSKRISLSKWEKMSISVRSSCGLKSRIPKRQAEN